MYFYSGNNVASTTTCKLGVSAGSMYDTVNNKFYGNDGKGQFKASKVLDETVISEDISYGDDYETVSNLTSTEGDIIHLYSVWKYSGSKNLPDGFESVEYISSNGTNDIDTGIYITDSDVLEIKAKFCVSNVEGRSLWGRQPSNRSFGLYMDSSIHKIVFYAGSDSAKTSTCCTDFIANKTYEVDAQIDASEKRINAICNGTQLGTYTYKGDVATGSIHLFNNADQTGQQYIGALYYFEMIKNGESLRNYIPCRCTEDETLGLYEIFGGNFYPVNQ